MLPGGKSSVTQKHWGSVHVMCLPTQNSLSAQAFATFKFSSRAISQPTAAAGLLLLPLLSVLRDLSLCRNTSDTDLSAPHPFSTPNSNLLETEWNPTVLCQVMGLPDSHNEGVHYILELCPITA